VFSDDVSGFWFLDSGFWFLVSGYLRPLCLSLSLSLTVDFLAPLLPGTLYAFVSSTPLANSISWPRHSSFFTSNPCASRAQPTRSLAAFTRLYRHWNAVSPLFAGLSIQAESQPHPGGFYCAIVVAHSSRRAAWLLFIQTIIQSVDSCHFPFSFIFYFHIVPSSDFDFSIQRFYDNIVTMAGMVWTT
jgi:hypothetical protein